MLAVTLVKYMKLKAHIPALIQTEFETWRATELAHVRTEQKDVAYREATVQLQQWRQDHEQLIRRDAIHKSQAVIVGKVTEHFVPHLPEFRFNPKDARFLGSPVDFVIFDGLDEGCIRKIVFAEIKTGNASLSSRERQIRDAIRHGQMEWVEVRVNRDPQAS